MSKTLDDKEKKYLENIGMRIKELREGLGMTQDSLAEKTGMDRGTIANLEKGRCNSEIATFFRVADSLNTSLEFLLATEKNQVSVISLQIVVELEKRTKNNPDLLRRLLAFIQGFPEP